MARARRGRGGPHARHADGRGRATRSPAGPSRPRSTWSGGTSRARPPRGPTGPTCERPRPERHAAPALRRGRPARRRPRRRRARRSRPWRGAIPEAPLERRAANWHVTLKFLGADAAGLVDRVTELIAGAARRRHARSRTRLEGLGAFPSTRPGTGAVGGPRRPAGRLAGLGARDRRGAHAGVRAGAAPIAPAPDGGPTATRRAASRTGSRRPSSSRSRSPSTGCACTAAISAEGPRRYELLAAAPLGTGLSVALLALEHLFG